MSDYQLTMNTQKKALDLAKSKGAENAIKSVLRNYIEHFGDAHHVIAIIDSVSISESGNLTSGEYMGTIMDLEEKLEYPYDSWDDYLSDMSASVALQQIHFMSHHSNSSDMILTLCEGLVSRYFTEEDVDRALQNYPK